MDRDGWWQMTFCIQQIDNSKNICTSQTTIDWYFILFSGRKKMRPIVRKGMIAKKERTVRIE